MQSVAIINDNAAHLHFLIISPASYLTPFPTCISVVVVVVLLFYVHGKHQRSCQDGQLT